MIEERVLFVDQPDRPRTPPGVGTPLRAVGLPGRRHPQEFSPELGRKFLECFPGKNALNIRIFRVPQEVLFVGDEEPPVCE